MNIFKNCKLRLERFSIKLVNKDKAFKNGQHIKPGINKQLGFFECRLKDSLKMESFQGNSLLAKNAQRWSWGLNSTKRVDYSWGSLWVRREIEQ